MQYFIIAAVTLLKFCFIFCGHQERPRRPDEIIPQIPDSSHWQPAQPRGGWKPRWQPPPPHSNLPFPPFFATTTSPKDTKIEQCPCVRAGSSGECVTYDPRYQAATWSEAIVNFPDLTNQSISADATDPSVFLGRGERFKCNSNDQKCKRCSQLLINHLWFIQAIDETERTELVRQLDVPDEKFVTDDDFDRAGMGLNCDRYRFVNQRKHDRKGQRKPPPPQSSIDGALKQIQKAGSANWWKQQTRSWHGHERGFGSGHWRGKRQTDQEQLLGTSTQLQCSERGSEDIDTGMLNICGVCWVWRKLPSNYFPSYINEIECKSTEGADGSCLSGFGECRTRTRNLSVLKNMGTEDEPNWVPESIAAGACCDCHVPAGSGIHSLVTDSPINNNNNAA